MSTSERLAEEAEIRSNFNAVFGLNAIKTRVDIGRSYHEFDIFERGKIIGGISTSPWKNTTGTNNSGGQDRVAAELLWLSLWPGHERRVVILTRKDMANRIIKRWQGCIFNHPIEIIHYDLKDKKLTLLGTLAD